jgi:hypothetical protein
MQIGLDRNLGHTTNLEVSSVKANTNPVIIPGDGSAAHPDLRATDLFAFLPFQSNARRFVIPYYVITQDVTKRLPEVRFDVNVTGFSPKATYTGYDPVTDKTFTINATPLAHGVGLQLPAIDYPRLLIVSGPTP